ncbi:MAG TPA: type II toxin-antitoxin system prevent-host-death family antitoxin [Clostridiales bacterium]|nr:type II toxin-antitoxin system prevent-host-death family antitoxin [Clostridiales bacterium]
MISVLSDIELQKNFEKYLKYVEDGNEIVILQDGKEVAKLVPYENSTPLTVSSIGVLKGDCD